ncbi:unnamed protein product [Polarella glacialis]|uniref:Uncharacterized protein n=1 Tax=Polarella glacialis TaxID=89957 RepID=A0A813FX83_POLGL|nr:unnamed protein product [Polarella glacialis]
MLRNGSRHVNAGPDAYENKNAGCALEQRKEQVTSSVILAIDPGCADLHDNFGNARTQNEASQCSLQAETECRNTSQLNHSRDIADGGAHKRHATGGQQQPEWSLSAPDISKYPGLQILPDTHIECLQTCDKFTAANEILLPLLQHLENQPTITGQVLLGFWVHVVV